MSPPLHPLCRQCPECGDGLRYHPPTDTMAPWWSCDCGYEALHPADKPVPVAFPGVEPPPFRPVVARAAEGQHFVYRAPRTDGGAGHKLVFVFVQRVTVRDGLREVSGYEASAFRHGWSSGVFSETHRVECQGCAGTCEECLRAACACACAVSA